MTKTIIIYHSPCPDGFTSAWVARKMFPDAEFYPTGHYNQPPDVTGKDVFILDFAYNRETLLALLDDASSITVLDHHKTNEKALEGLVFCKFDMHKSGAGLTWDYFFGNKPFGLYSKPWLIDYVQDRDLWQWRLPYSREVCAALDSYPYEFEVWDKLANREIEDLAAEGAAIRRYQNQAVDRVMRHAREVVFEGHLVPVVNCSTLIDDVGSRLAIGKPFSVLWRQSGDGIYIYSMRSDEDGLDVSEIAKKFPGGGGHKHAAGFSTNIQLF